MWLRRGTDGAVVNNMGVRDTCYMTCLCPGCTTCISQGIAAGHAQPCGFMGVMEPSSAWMIGYLVSHGQVLPSLLGPSSMLGAVYSKVI